MQCYAITSVLASAKLSKKPGMTGFRGQALFGQRTCFNDLHFLPNPRLAGQKMLSLYRRHVQGCKEKGNFARAFQMLMPDLV